MLNSYKRRLELEHKLIMYWISVHKATIWINSILKYIITSDIQKHKVAIRIGRKAGLLKLVKSPICARKTFQIYEDAHELAKESGQANKWWKDNSIMLFFVEKEGEWRGKKTRQVLLD